MRITMQSRYEFLTRPESEPLGYFLDRPGIQKLHLALLDLGAQRATLANRLGPNHPQMVELGRQEAEIKRQLRAEVEQEVNAVRSRYDAALLREEQLRQKLAEQQEASIELRDLGARYDLLKNEVEGARSLHESLLKQQMETAVNSELAASNMRVIDRAEVPGRPSKPNVPLNLTVGVLAGLVFAVGSAFLCEYFDNSVKSSDEVEELLQIPSLAMIPNFVLARRSGRLAYGVAGDGNGAASNGGGPTEASNGFGGELVVLREPRSPAAEAFRTLRTAILFSAPGAPPKVILVTSAGAGEGKTVSSVNLATSLAEAGSRVLLLDGDLRRPGCHRALGLENDRGLSNFLAGQADLGSVIHALDAPRVFFVPAGPAAPNPAELVGSARMRDTLEELRGAYDFIILDSPPVLPVTDAVVLAREADGVVLVVKGDDTPRELVRRARDLLMQANTHLLGAVVNNVDVGWGGVYLYNRYYGGYYAEPPAGEEHA
jgi:capsular exopolysaccharide synthesis family protein